jgi:L-asparaginase II
MGFDDQLWSYLVNDHGADQIQWPVGARTASVLAADRSAADRGHDGCSFPGSPPLPWCS